MYILITKKNSQKNYIGSKFKIVNKSCVFVGQKKMINSSICVVADWFCDMNMFHTHTNTHIQMIESQNVLFCLKKYDWQKQNECVLN